MWQNLLGLGITLLTTHFVGTPQGNQVRYRQQGVCDVKNDLVILLDSSSNFPAGEFTKAKNYIAEFAANLKTSKGNRVGFRVFTVQAQTVVPLENIYTPDQVAQFVRTANHFNQPDVYFNNSLLDAYHELVEQSPRDVNRTVLLIAGGKSLDASATKRAAKQLLDGGVRTYAVGVTTKVDRSEILSITGNNDERTFFGNNVDNLPKILEQITTDLCHVGVDVNILLDSSYRHQGVHYSRIKNVIASLVQKLADEPNTRIGLRVFGQDFKTYFTVKDQLSTTQMVNFVQSIAYLNSNVQNPEKAINAATQELTAAANGNKQIILIFMSDLPPIDAAKSQAASNAARTKGILPKAVGLGSGVSENVLTNLIGSHRDQFFWINDYLNYQSDLHKIVDSIYN